MPHKPVTISRADIASGKAKLAAHSKGQALPLVPPGEVLEQEFMLPMTLSARALARD